MCVFVKEFDVRKLARAEGRRYCNATALTYQAERMPEQIRVNVRIVYRVEYTCTYMCNDEVRCWYLHCVASRCVSG